MNAQLGDLKQLRSSTGTVFAVLVLILTVAMYGWIVAPHIAYLKAVQQYEPIVDNMVKEKTRLQSMLETRRKRLELIDMEFAEIRDILFTFDQAQGFFRNLGSMAEASNCDIRMLDILTDKPVLVIGHPDDLVSVGTLDAEVSVVGYYDGLLTFIDHLQNNRRKIAIRSLQILVNRDEDIQLKCDVSLTLYIIQEREAD